MCFCTFTNINISAGGSLNIYLFPLNTKMYPFCLQQAKKSKVHHHHSLHHHHHGIQTVQRWNTAQSKQPNTSVKSHRGDNSLRTDIGHKRSKVTSSQSFTSASISSNSARLKQQTRSKKGNILSKVLHFLTNSIHQGKQEVETNKV